MPTTFQLLADLVLVIHASFVAFVVFGLPMIVAGGLCHWRWVRGPIFRLLHLAAIGVVAAQAWLGIPCPLTTLENWLRIQAMQAAYSGSFIEHWLHAVLFYRAPDWVFIALYSGFAALVLAVWIWIPPRGLGRS